MTNTSSEKHSSQKRGISYGLLAVIVALTLIIGFIAGTRSHQLASIFPFLKQQSLDLSSIQETYNQLQRNYDGKLDVQKLLDGANRGLAEAAGDPYTTFLTADEAAEFTQELEGTFSGVGAELGRRDDKLTIISTLDNSPARRAGLRANDVIVRINDEPATGFSVDKAVGKIRGEKGTTVKITILREGEQEVKDFTITRDVITDPSVKSEIKDGIGIMRISRFGDQDTVILARSIAQEFKDRGVKGVVVDVRGNGGGYVDTAQGIASLWLDSQPVVIEKGKNVPEQTITSGANPILKGIPTVVLIDGGSASASEILAGALKDHRAAKLAGTVSFGKGSVQKIIAMPHGGQLKVTVAKWFTPLGKNIDKEGIAPDFEVKLSEEDINKGRDPQRDWAIRELKR
ncbi:MAG TPA: S41 family peptidase [Verrucomicrobiae bacterium]|nr:S41 family peptidase [Verrucomicrobiae bacterium]